MAIEGYGFQILAFMRRHHVSLQGNDILVTDSCYGGAVRRSAPTPGLSIPDRTGYERYAQKLRQLAGKRSRQVIASGGFEQVPDESEFARLLKSALRSNAYPLVDLK